MEMNVEFPQPTRPPSGSPSVSIPVVGCKGATIVASIAGIALAASSIAYTYFFMAIICICLILSVASIIGEFVLSGSRMFFFIDIGYHLGIGVLLMISSILYIVKIKEIADKVMAVVQLQLQQRGGYNLTVSMADKEAYAAGAIGIITALLCVIIAILVYNLKNKHSSRIQ